MKKTLHKTLLITLILGTVATVNATETKTVATTTMATDITPEQSRQLLVDYFKKMHPDVKFEDLRFGSYNFSADKKSQWESIKEFPPYLDHIDEGEALYKKDLAIYSKCFGDDVTNIRVNFPYFNEETQKVVTLEFAINQCRINAGLEPYRWKRGDLAKVSAYLAYNSRGQTINVRIETEGARKAFENGKDFFLAPRGQFDLSCAECHTSNAGKKVRAQILSPVVGHTTHFPAYRAKWQDIGTLHRRYGGCNANIRAKPEKPQSVAYSNLEFFQAFMSNGLEIDGPDYRE